MSEINSLQNQIEELVKKRDALIIQESNLQIVFGTSIKQSMEHSPYFTISFDYKPMGSALVMEVQRGNCAPYTGCALTRSNVMDLMDYCSRMLSTMEKSL